MTLQTSLPCLFSLSLFFLETFIPYSLLCLYAEVKAFPRSGKQEMIQQSEPTMQVLQLYRLQLVTDISGLKSFGMIKLHNHDVTLEKGESTLLYPATTAGEKEDCLYLGHGCTVVSTVLTACSSSTWTPDALFWLNKAAFWQCGTYCLFLFHLDIWCTVLTRQGRILIAQTPCGFNNCFLDDVNQCLLWLCFWRLCCFTYTLHIQMLLGFFLSIRYVHEATFTDPPPPPPELLKQVCNF